MLWTLTSLIAVLLFVDAPQHPQGLNAAEALRLSRASVDAADTAAAISILEEAIEALPSDARIVSELAWLHAARASPVPVDFSERKRAEEYALRAWRLDPKSPRALSALAFVRLKQQTPSAAAALAEEAMASPAFSSLSSQEKADLHFLLGLCAASRVRDFEDMIVAPADLSVASPSCSALGYFCRNFTRPAQFNQKLANSPSLENLTAADRQRMMESYRTAVDLDPTHVPALSKLLLALADRGDWNEYVRYARPGAAANPNVPLAQLLLGLGLYHKGAIEDAEAAFSRGLDSLSPEERLALIDPRGLLSARDSAVADLTFANQVDELTRAVWLKFDPLYLTDVNERWVGHLARVTYADLKFTPESGKPRGSRTDAGRVYVRYGPPREVWSIARDRSKETDALQMMQAFELLGCIQQLAYYSQAELKECRRIEAQARQSLSGGGRWIFWNYLPDRPSLVFSRDLAFSNMRFLPGSYSDAYEDQVRERLPTHFEPFDETLEIPHQISRFKGLDPSDVELEIFAAFPIKDLARPGNRWIEIGSFFIDSTYSNTHAWKRRVPTRYGSRVYRLSQTLPSASYDYSIEACDRSANSIARARGRLAGKRFPPDTLSISDILIARDITAIGEPAETRADLRIAGSADLRFEAGEPVGLYWEVYGLAVVDGLARYRVTLSVVDAEERSLPVRIIRGVADFLGATGSDVPDVSWVREIGLEDRDRAIDWVVLGRLPEGRHRLRVILTDEMSGQVIEGERIVSVGGASDGD
ncbi:MAG: GWxTD domain-containing protein [Gammaproteobacteria bacterium]|uniref:GWxTD domain-containing protein n=1 Tax=Candidatus Kutchimonas denitrificans TaxID=3056748 RepID=A0AAE4Z9H4_9BACT|nr:GWxTD domain-containing protein [Gemmatimonadota bacterium]NIR75132.1 GWxTD domain-containing protein [Candidatus Kutchimonas denitrificans]NIU52942.1 GWxTD domain-containing protein [Gemmatimonadota bacterium]NIV52411.1 GWxTD domain-containing protein [Gammaproteobacteria bacterium]NIY44831.1 GWxTD domain-containing protein [Gemmatimonadota bacterium]